MNVPIKWDKLFVEMVKLIAKRSKDPATQVGVVIVSPDKTRIHYGYNGFPTGIEDTKERWQRPEKYKRVVHSEVNAILHAKEDLAGWTLYVTIPPCRDCAKIIIQAGIKIVYYIDEPKAASGYEYPRDLFYEAGAKLIKYKEE